MVVFLECIGQLFFQSSLQIIQGLPLHLNTLEVHLDPGQVPGGVLRLPIELGHASVRLGQHLLDTTSTNHRLHHCRPCTHDGRDQLGGSIHSTRTSWVKSSSQAGSAIWLGGQDDETNKDWLKIASHCPDVTTQRSGVGSRDTPFYISCLKCVNSAGGGSGVGPDRIQANWLETATSRPDSDR